MLIDMRSLRKLNISNNQELSCSSIFEIIRSFKTMPELQEIDLSKNNTDSVDCFRELADFII